MLCSAQTDWLKGQVIDRLTNKPIQYANVWYQDSTTIGASTDSLGQFTIQLINHDVLLIYSPFGYFMDTIKIQRGNDKEVLIKLIPLTEAPPKYYYVIAGDTILFNRYDSDNGLQCPGTGPKGCNTYCNGELCEGEITTYFVNGQIYKIANYTNGELIDGQYKAYYESGQIDQIGKYKDGHRNGQWLFYSESGFLESVYIYDSLGRRNTEYWFYEDGTLDFYINIDRDSACIKSMTGFYESGMMEGQTYQPNCEMDSTVSIDYYQNGIIKSIKSYKSNIEHGASKYFNNEGKLIKTERYNLGELIEVKEY